MVEPWLGYWAMYPPSGVMVWPVTKEAASEHSQTTASAISSGIPSLPIGVWETILRSKSGFASMPGLGHWCADVAGTDGVDSYTGCCILQCSGPGDPDNPVLGGVISNVACSACQPVDGGGVYYRATAPSSP